MEPIISIKDFKKSFGSKVVHRDINLQVFSGECLGLFGGSGTGKSVLLRSLIGLEKPDGGSVEIWGQNIVPLREKQLLEVRKKVAYAFQGGALFDSMNVFDNLAYPLREHLRLSNAEIKDRIYAILGRFGMQDAVAVFPNNLSGGMQKRVGLARALILDPQVILYDEPTAGLDPFNTKKIVEMVLMLKAQGRTGLLVTHDMPFAFEVCDRIALIDQGTVAATATVKELRENKNHPIFQFIKGEVA